MLDFSSLSYEDLQKLVAEQWTDEMETSRKFYDGDHWQDGTAYTGPRPDPGDPVTYNAVMEEIRREFTSQNVIAEVTDRRVNGVTGRPVTFTVINPENEEADDDELVAEALELLDKWIDEREAHDKLHDAITAMTWGGRGPLRLFIPRSELIEGENGLVVPAGEPLDQAMRVYINSPRPESAAIIVDEETQQRAGVYFYTIDKAKYAELVYTVTTGTQAGDQARAGALTTGSVTPAEPGDKITMIRIIPGPGAEQAESMHPLPLGGMLTLYEAKYKPLITPQIKSMQKSLNKNKTMWSRNQNLAGFLERTILNAELPGEWVYDESTGKDKFVAHPYKTGPGAMTALIGIEIEDNEGNKSLMRPDIIYRDPVSVETFVETDTRWYMSILQEAHQAHYSIAGDAVASAESRIAAMADYIVDLKHVAGKLQKAALWMARTLLAVSAYMAGEPGKFDGLEIKAKANIYPGPVPADLMRVISDLHEKGIYSLERVMAELGVDDPLAEKKKIEQERKALGMDIPTIEQLLQGAQTPNGQQPANGQQQGQRPPQGNARGVQQNAPALTGAR